MFSRLAHRAPPFNVSSWMTPVLPVNFLVSLPFCRYGLTVITRSIGHIGVLLMLLYSIGTCAGELRSYFEIAGSLYNPDWELRENASGIRLSGAWFATERVRFRATYNSADTDVVNLPIRNIRGLPFRNWRELGAGYVHTLSRSTSLETEISYQAVDLYDDIEAGPAVTVGIQHIFGKRFTGALRLGWFDLQGSDTRFTGELFTTLRPGVALVTRIDDTSNFDFTWYEVGLRFAF